MKRGKNRDMGTQWLLNLHMSRLLLKEQVPGQKVCSSVA